MPTYEYVCTKGHTFETVQSIKDEPLKRCPTCNSSVRRVINGGIGVIFKGSGFYTTDYKKSSALTGGNGGSKEKEKSAEGAATKAPEKPKEPAGGKTSEKK
ncbi:MAG: FmdB family zinc ribbon protein [Spirochaetia bacterium]